MAKKIIKRTKDGETLYFGTHTDAVLSEVRVGKESLTATLSAIITSFASYYTKSETYSQAEVDQLVSAIKQFNVVVASSLPTASASTMNTIYLIPSSHSEQGNVKDEFITIQDGGSYKWEQIGTTSIDLSGYSTTAEMNAAISNVSFLNDVKVNEISIDDVPTAGSHNLVESGGVATEIINITGSDDEQINLAPYIADAHNGIIEYSSGIWEDRFSTAFQHIIIPVVVGQTYKLLADTSGSLSLRYAPLKSYSGTDTPPDYCSGWSTIAVKEKGVEVEITIPQDSTCLYLQYKDNNNTAILSVVSKGKKGLIDTINLSDSTQVDIQETQLNLDLQKNVGTEESPIYETISDIILPCATEEKAGLMSAQDRNEFKNAFGAPDEQIDLSPYIADAHNGVIDYNTKTWENIYVSTFQHIIVPVIAGRKYKLLADVSGGLSLRYAPLKSYSGTSTSPDYCSGYSNIGVAAKGVEVEFVAPSDCNYLYLQYKNNGDTASLSVVLSGTDGYIAEMQAEMEGIKNNSASNWDGKHIAWFGTSIPAGGNFPVPIKANAIDAYLTPYKVEKTVIDADDNLPCEYPVIAASLLGASTIYNESVGSSKIVKDTTAPILSIRCKALTNTVEEICSYIWGSYNIDIANQTFEENHNNVIGITTFLTTAGTWSSFVNNVMTCLSQSYQIRVSLRHLINDSTQRSIYVQDVFGEYYDRVVAMLTSVGYTLDDLAGYGEADLFVLEHSVNDSNPSMNYPVTSTDVTTFQGAYNKIIGEILRYKPSARIVIVSNYGPDASEIQYDKDKTAKLKEIAEHWQIAFCEMRKYINVSATKQLTQGYWDKNANVWHDSGFQWSEDAGNDSFTTNAYIHPNLYDSSLSVIKQNINPQLIHGVWYWETPARYIWMRDAVHPHSDNSGRLCIILAKTLAKWLDVLGNI